ncbi:TauD/TfdA family dioxygenase [Aestuariicella hydrocarbonica]|uniref:TauD/TfdA family dioxygenase n=1 Tax=Pseudomaricurvus hydrocarbonicus TaxID=1470433 RepID=A0A9E5JUW0_9GAMM|nr:TauD/TfdA family dioxygenase [Aestuariicella hydrocarbonica]NHO66013.1 TauD/TfdA family dioxygenase [Aestuariicella hydrocarbonica]
MVNVSVEPISPQLGARVYVSADQLLVEGVPEQCLALLNTHGVLVFPAIGVSDQLQVEFSNRLGQMKASKIYTNGDDSGDSLGIYPVTLDPGRAKYIDYIVSNEHWHMDGTTYAVPPKATNLKCEVPASSGGDTEFANLFAAYEQLPDEKKAQLQGLRVVHGAAAANLRSFKNPSIVDLERWMRDGPATEQPLVWQQADGRCALVVGSTADHIVGMDLDAGRALLQELLDWCTQPQFCYRHQWQKGDMVIWNNPGLLHRAHHYTLDSGRLMHRTTINGSEALA